jgi:hypothetical protein
VRKCTWGPFVIPTHCFFFLELPEHTSNREGADLHFHGHRDERVAGRARAPPLGREGAQPPLLLFEGAWRKTTGEGRRPWISSLAAMGQRAEVREMERTQGLGEHQYPWEPRGGEEEKWHVGEGRGQGLPFIEESSGHVRLQQQVAGDGRATLGAPFRRFPLGIRSRLL